MANIFLAIPQYKRMPEAEIQRIAKELKLEGWEPTLNGFHPMFDVSVTNLFSMPNHKIRYGIIWGDGNLPRARAFHLGVWRAEYETENKCDYFMIVDEDLSFTPEDIDLLIEDDKPIIGGIYTFKTSNPNYQGKACTRFFDDKNTILFDRPFQVRWLNGGFILVKAEVLLHMIDAYKDLAFDVTPDSQMGMNETWSLWCPRVFERVFLSEDWAFCQRARELGYDIWADFRVKLLHWQGEYGYGLSIPKKEELCQLQSV